MMVGLTGLTAVLMVQLATAAPKPIDTSLATIPTGYFGGSGATGGGSYHRSDADIAELANQRVIVIEKWEGPCWDECLANSSHTLPVLGATIVGASSGHTETPSIAIVLNDCHVSTNIGVSRSSRSTFRYI